MYPIYYFRKIYFFSFFSIILFFFFLPHTSNSVRTRWIHYQMIWKERLMQIKFNTKEKKNDKLKINFLSSFLFFPIVTFVLETFLSRNSIDAYEPSIYVNCDFHQCYSQLLLLHQEPIPNHF